MRKEIFKRRIRRKLKDSVENLARYFLIEKRGKA